MTSDVVLSAALRNNLLSLQSTQRGIDSTQLKLSTGKKVNSALDNPQSFFASQSLTNRANDLTRLLDGIGQSIQVIKAADNGVTALTSLINQADSIANQAQDALSANTAANAKITGTVDARAVTLTASGFANGDTFAVTSIDSSGNKIAKTITVATGDTGYTLVNKINTAFAPPTGSNGQITASLNSSGNLIIEAEGGYSFRIDAFTGTAGASAAATTTALTALGINTYFGTEQAGAATTALAATINGNGSVIQSGVLTTNGNNLATANTAIVNLVNFANVNASTDGFVLTTSTGATITVDLFTGSPTIQNLVDQINGSSTVGAQVKASFDSSTGRINLEVTDSTVKYLRVGTAASVETLAFGFGSRKVDGTAGTANGGSTEVIAVSSTASSVTALQNQFNAIRTQIDALVTNGDTGYKGTNLLNGDSLLTVFNENRTSTLTTTGQTFTSAGLGISAGNFATQTAIDTALSQVRDALSTVRNFGSSLAGNLSVIQTRQDFTNSLINTLKEGSDLLVNADQNEEGAKLLALQTRQSLGVTALSLASQSQQSILRLFG